MTKRMDTNGISSELVSIAGRGMQEVRKVSGAGSASGTVTGTENKDVYIKVTGASQVRFNWGAGVADATNGLPMDYGDVEIVRLPATGLKYYSGGAFEFVYIILD